MKYITTDKMTWHPEALTNFIRGKENKPITVEIWLSMECDHKCYYCSMWGVKKPQKMTKEQIEKAINFLGDIGVQGLIFSGGGEPTVNPHFTYALELAKSKGMDVGVITHGSHLKGELLDTILKVSSWVRISLDSPNNETYEKIRQVKELDNVRSNIVAALKRKRELESDTTIGCQMVVNQHNFKEVEDFVNVFSKEFEGINYMQIRPVEVRLQQEPYNEEQLDVIKKQLDNIRDVPRVEINPKWDLFYGKRTFGFSACHCADLIGAVNSSGDYYLCCHLVRNEAYKLGNILEQSPEEFFESRRKALNLLGNKKGLDYALCPVGCRGSSMNRFLEGLTRDHPHKNFL